MPPFETLKYLMDHHIRLQFYAETKNGVLLGLCAASLAPITALLKHQVENDKLFKFEWWAASSAFVLVFLSALVLLLSFHPIASPEIEPEQSKKSIANSNVFYFGDVTGQTPIDIAAATIPKDSTVEPSHLEIKLASQIHTIAAITAQKFRFFKTAAWLALLGYLILALALGATALST